MNHLRDLYYETHIFGTEKNFLSQANNVDWVYLVLYWVNQEALYPIFLNEEMDYQALILLEEKDIRYFHLEQCEPFTKWILSIK